MKNNARKMAMENQIDLVQQNAIDFTHACMTIALHEVFGVGKERLDKVTRRKDEINGELMRRMALPAKNRKAQLDEAEKWLVGLLPEGVVSVFRIPVVKGVPRKRREVQLKMAIDKAATLEWCGYAAACAQVLGFGPQRLEKLRQETIANFGQLNEWVEQDGVDVAMEMLCRCARDAYKTDVQVEDVPDEAVLERQRRETAAMVRQLEVQAVRQEVSRMRVPCVLPLSEAAMREKVEAVNACFDAATTGAATGSNLSPLRSGYASALQSSPDMGAKDQGGR